VPRSVSHAPRLHAVAYRAIGGNGNPLSSAMSASPLWHSRANVLELRNRVIRMLATALVPECAMAGGELQAAAEMAANYLLCNMVSRVLRRHEALCIGKFALNVVGCSGAVVARIASLMPLLLPRSVYLPMLLEALNTIPFVPRMDYGQGRCVPYEIVFRVEPKTLTHSCQLRRLLSGALQLSDSTFVIVDECRFTTGTLEQQGMVRPNA